MLECVRIHRYVHSSLHILTYWTWITPQVFIRENREGNVCHKLTEYVYDGRMCIGMELSGYSYLDTLVGSRPQVLMREGKEKNV